MGLFYVADKRYGPNEGIKLGPYPVTLSDFLLDTRIVGHSNLVHCRSSFGRLFVAASSPSLALFTEKV